MDRAPTEDLLLVSLRAATEPGGSAALSTVAETATGGGQRLSQQVEVAVAVETLVEQGLVRRDRSDGAELLRLTEDGRARATEVRDRVAECRIEVVDGDERREVTVGDAAAELDRSPAAVAAECSPDGAYYAQQRVDADGLVDRTAERAAFDDVLERVGRSDGGAVVRVVGPGGSGKTTLVDATLDAWSGSVDVARVRCRGNEDEPYRPVRDALARAGGDDPFDATGVPVEDADAYETRQARLFGAVTESLTPESGARVLFFDDVDAADAATWSYLAFLCDRVADRPLAVVLAHRPGTLPEDAPIHPETGLAETCIEVPGLDRESTARLVERVLGRRGAPEAFVDAVFERTGGMALYVETTVEALVDTGQLDPGFQWYPSDPAEFDLPDAVTETVKQQAATFEADVRELLEWVAVARGFVPLSVLESAAGIATDPLGPLLGTGLLRRESRDGETYVTVANDVFGDALLERLSETERERRHATVARLLEGESAGSEGDSEETADRAATIAAHYERGGDPGAAVEWYQRAAERATDVYAHETAVDHYHRAIEAAQETGDTEAVLSATERLAEIYTVVAEYEQAERHVQFVRERTGADDPRRRQRVARLAARIHSARGEYDAAIEAASAGLDYGDHSSEEQCRLLDVLAAAYNAQSDYAKVREAAERGRDLARELGQRDLEADALHRLGAAATHQGDYEQARDYHERCLDLARETGDRHGEANSLRSLGRVALRRDDYEQAREYFERSLEVTRETGDRSGEVETVKSLGSTAWSRDEYDRAREYFERGLDLARELGDRHVEAKLVNNLGLIAWVRSEYDEGETYFERSLEINQLIGDRSSEAGVLINLGLIAWGRGEYDEGEAYFERSLDVTREIGDRSREAKALNNLGNIALRRGEYDRAREMFESSLEIKRELGNRRGEAETLDKLGTLARIRGDHERARAHYEDSRDIARELELPDWEAVSLAGRCALARQRGDLERASEDADRALGLVEDVEAEVRTGRVRLEAGRLALARGDDAAARDRAETARELFAELGDPFWIARSRRLCGRVAARTGDPATARDHWRAAVETFAAVGAPADALRTLEHLVETSLTVGDDEAAREWYERGRETLADAPATVGDTHGAWLEEHAAVFEAE